MFLIFAWHLQGYSPTIQHNEYPLLPSTGRTHHRCGSYWAHDSLAPQEGRAQPTPYRAKGSSSRATAKQASSTNQALRQALSATLLSHVFSPPFPT